MDFKVTHTAWIPKDFSQPLLSASEQNLDGQLIKWTSEQKSNNVLAILSQQVLLSHKLVANSTLQMHH